MRVFIYKFFKSIYICKKIKYFEIIIQWIKTWSNQWTLNFKSNVSIQLIWLFTVVCKIVHRCRCTSVRKINAYLFHLFRWKRIVLPTNDSTVALIIIYITTIINWFWIVSKFFWTIPTTAIKLQKKFNKFSKQITPLF